MLAEKLTIADATQRITGWEQSNAFALQRELHKIGGEDAIKIYTLLNIMALRCRFSRHASVPVEYLMYGVGFAHPPTHAYTSAQITGMLKRLRNRGFITHHPFDGSTDEWAVAS